MKRGDIVRLSQEGLDWIYGSKSAWQDRARDYRYVFWGYPRNKWEREHGIIRVKRLISYSFLTFHKSFLQLADEKEGEK